MITDKGIKQRYMRVGINKPVSDRVDFSNLSEQVILTHQHDKEKIVLSLLPAAEDDEVLRCNMIILISRVLIENMDFFKFSFDGVGQWCWTVAHQT